MGASEWLNKLGVGNSHRSSGVTHFMSRLGLSLVLLIVPALYLSTLARSLVLGDPTEYTFVAHILGIAHPPGYAFITLAGKLFQTLVPLGDIPWRMHLLSATAAFLGAWFVYGIIREIDIKIRRAQGQEATNKAGAWGVLSALLASLTVATAADYWQHAIHANPHIITAAFLAANLFFLTKWWVGQQGVGPPNATPSQKWLYVFCFSAGLGVTHHPLTVFAFPAYAVFILLVRPSLLRQGRSLLTMVGFALLGLSLWLYFPIRSAMEPAFGPATMDTLNGFLDHVLARGLSNTLPYYSPADQPGRALVFWTLLRLQYSLPLIFLALFGWLWLAFARSDSESAGSLLAGRFFAPRPFLPLAVLYGLAFVGNYAFVISLKVQDIMAYLLGPFLLVGLLAGVGLYGLIALIQRRLRLQNRVMALLVGALFLLGPALQLIRNAPHISLRHYDEGRAYVETVFDRFQGSNEGAVLLNDWEHMTPLWYARYVEGRWPDVADVRPQWVSTGVDDPWLASVINYLPGGPVYLSNYRRQVVDFGFRLRPAGPFYQVVEKGETQVPPTLTLFQANASGGDVEPVGYRLPQSAVSAGDYVPLILAMRAPEGTDDYYVPVLHVGDINYTFTTDSHLISPLWGPGEVIVERFDFALPHDLAGGDYPVTVGLKNLSTDRETDLNLPLGTLHVSEQAFPVRADHLLANFRQRVGLVEAAASNDGRRLTAPWPQPLSAQAGDTIYLTLEWQSLAPAEESYTVFVHLIDLADQLAAPPLDYTPLGGAAPTYLWIPKWLPGQRLLDPYRLQLPPNLAPGLYRIEVGMYEMVSRRRLHIADEEGNLIGDRYILGEVRVEE